MKKTMTISVFQYSLQVDDHNGLPPTDQNLQSTSDRLETATMRLQAAVKNLQAEVMGLQSAALGLQSTSQSQLPTQPNGGLLEYLGGNGTTNTRATG